MKNKYLPSKELLEFMRNKSYDLFEMMMDFVIQLSDEIPDEPRIVNSVIESVFSASIASFLNFRYCNFTSHEKLDAFLKFIQCTVENFEKGLSDRLLNKIIKEMERQHEMDTD